MIEDLSPEGINKHLGYAAWKCWGCKTETGLYWYNGWSVAVCGNPECSKAYWDMCKQQIAEQERYEAYVKEYYG